MNNKCQNLLGYLIIFLIAWLITSLVWMIWLDSFSAALLGCFTALALLGVFNVVIHIGGK